MLAEWDLENEHKRRNIVIVTFLACKASDGLVVSTVIRTAVTFRKGWDGKIIDMPRDELLQGLFVILQLYGLVSVWNETGAERILREVL
jgi:hypothetical protein